MGMAEPETLAFGDILTFNPERADVTKDRFSGRTFVNDTCKIDALCDQLAQYSFAKMEVEKKETSPVEGIEKQIKLIGKTRQLEIYASDHTIFIQKWEKTDESYQLEVFQAMDSEPLAFVDNWVQSATQPAGPTSVVPGSEFELLKCEKPIIYLYPESTEEISVNLDTKASIDVSYPAYNDGWKVTAHPDGRLRTPTGVETGYLYWEGKMDFQADYPDGFIVSSDQVAGFLDEKLEFLGLNYDERTDFITYWLPDLQENAYNKIRFLTDEYDQIAKLNVTPRPDTEIRVFMLFEPAEEGETLPEQVLEPKERAGFTLVDWGGACTKSD